MDEWFKRMHAEHSLPSDIEWNDGFGSTLASFDQSRILSLAKARSQTPPICAR
jgi:hypothetical protein